MICRHPILVDSLYEDYQRCASCNTLVHRDPLTSQEAYETGYWEPESSHGSLYDHQHNVDAHKENGLTKIEFTLAHIPIHSHHVAEVACAPGNLMNALIRLGYADKVTGFEVDDRYDQDIRGIAGYPVDLRFGYFPFSAKDIPDGEFDCIIALDFYEHMHFPVKVAQDFHRLLNNNGKLLLMLPLVEDDGTLTSPRMCSPEHCFLFSKKWMMDTFTELGFKDIEFGRWVEGHDSFRAVKA